MLRLDAVNLRKLSSRSQRIRDLVLPDNSEQKLGGIGSISMCPCVVQRADKMVMHDQAAIAKARIPSVGGRSGRRIYIEDVYPLVDAGRFPVKRIIGEPVDVWADIFRDGHAVLAAELLWRPEASHGWSRAPMRLHDNDRWTAIFTPPSPGRYLYAIEAWTDVFATWRRDFLAKRHAGIDVKPEIEEGRSLLATLKPRGAAQTRLIREIWRTSTSAVSIDRIASSTLIAKAGFQNIELVRGSQEVLATGRRHRPNEIIPQLVERFQEVRISISRPGLMNSLSLWQSSIAALSG